MKESSYHNQKRMSSRKMIKTHTTNLTCLANLPNGLYVRGWGECFYYETN